MASQKCGKTSKPDWLKIRLPRSEQYARTSSLVEQNGLHTICSSGKCPNISECWSNATATFMIAGEICTRACRFCATASGRPLPLDPAECEKIAHSVDVMKLRHAVITSVDRDDLDDGGAAHWVATVKAIAEKCPNTTIEILIPDFDGRRDLLDIIAGAGAHIIGHNMETVRRVSPLVRSRATYDRSLEVLGYLSSKGVITKSGLMVGLGETPEEVIETLGDMYNVGVRRATIGQYLQPSKSHVEVAQYVHPDTFEMFRQKALDLGFTHIESAPLVRSSYHAKL